VEEGGFNHRIKPSESKQLRRGGTFRAVSTQKPEFLGNVLTFLRA
jgi:hypothetical protein